ncbi:MAG: hypothetical protein ACRD2C_01445 [Acidimicrobiales bacterium]
MERQLHLLATETGSVARAARGASARKPHRPISAKNRAVGRRGLAQARAALHAARRVPTGETQQPRPSSANTRRRTAA